MSGQIWNGLIGREMQFFLTQNRFLQQHAHSLLRQRRQRPVVSLEQPVDGGVQPELGLLVELDQVVLGGVQVEVVGVVVVVVVVIHDGEVVFFCLSVKT